jgi:hypothetical protein
MADGRRTKDRSLGFFWQGLPDSSSAGFNRPTDRRRIFPIDAFLDWQGQTEGLPELAIKHTLKHKQCG